MKQVVSASKVLSALTQVGKELSKGPHGEGSLQDLSGETPLGRWEPSFSTESGKGVIQPFYVEKLTINNEATAESKDAFVRTEKP